MVVLVWVAGCGDPPGSQDSCAPVEIAELPQLEPDLGVARPFSVGRGAVRTLITQERVLECDGDPPYASADLDLFSIGVDGSVTSLERSRLGPDQNLCADASHWLSLARVLPAVDSAPVLLEWNLFSMPPGRFSVSLWEPGRGDGTFWSITDRADNPYQPFYEQAAVRDTRVYATWPEYDLDQEGEPVDTRGRIVVGRFESDGSPSGKTALLSGLELSGGFSQQLRLLPPREAPAADAPLLNAVVYVDDDQSDSAGTFLVPIRDGAGALEVGPPERIADAVRDLADAVRFQETYALALCDEGDVPFVVFLDGRESVRVPEARCDSHRAQTKLYSSGSRLWLTVGDVFVTRVIPPAEPLDCEIGERPTLHVEEDALDIEWIESSPRSAAPRLVGIRYAPSRAD